MAEGSIPVLKVLIVDDSPFMRRVIRLLIEASGRFVVVGEAADGWEGLELARRLKPDLITLDRQMPRLDGWQMLKKLREESDVPVLMVSALPTEMDRQDDAPECGEVETVIKGFSDNPLDLSVFADELTTKLARAWTLSKRRSNVSDISRFQK
jgi:two-component system chemotaxis response regulator CheB